MIRRISKHCDLKDLIKSCPSGVIDDIYAIEYYIQGYNTVIQANFTKKETMLEVIIPSTDLETLPNGILMRRAYYKVLDASYPDGYYNLEFEDNMNVWIGENESEEPVIPEYVTEEELTAALGDLDGNTVEDYVVEVGHRVLDTVAETYATRSWVASQRYAKRDWVEQQNYTSQTYVDNQISSQATRINNIEESYVSSDGLDTILTNYATHFWVQEWAQSQGYLNSNSTLPADQITLSLPDLPQNVEGALTQLSGYIDTITTEDIPDLDSRITALEQSSGSSVWGGITGTITNQTDLMNLLDGYATQVNLTTLEDSLLTEIDDTKADLQNEIEGALNLIGGCVKYNEENPLYDGYNKVITTFEPGNSYTPLLILINNEEGEDAQYDGIKIDISGIYKYSANNYEVPGTWSETTEELATQDWIQNQGYASQQWVQNQGYLTSSSTLPASQITCNISGDVFDFDDVDEGLRALVSRVEDQMDEITSLDDRVTDLENAGYATQTWVQQQGYITSSALSGYATESWVQNQGYLDSSDLSGYATQSWVQQQGYLTQHQDLTGYATQTWATDQFLEENKVWTGTETQWNALTPAQKASYTIALIVE